MRINIYTSFNGVGLQRDYNILKNIFESYGHIVDYCDNPYRRGYDHHRPEKAEIAFHLEIPRFELMNYAKKNILFPNPEWFDLGWQRKLNQFDAVYAKTMDCFNVFSAIHHNVVFTSFTSIDQFNANISKEKIFLHTAGKSSFKGTNELIEAYRRNDMPKCFMTTQQNHKGNDNLIATGYLNESEFNVMLNACLIHICPSYYEGYGHIIGEAMSCGAVVITTDAQPMSDFITDKMCLVKSHRKGRQNFGTLHYPDVEDLVSRIRVIESMNTAELIKIGKSNREKYLKNDAEFKKKIIELLC